MRLNASGRHLFSTEYSPKTASHWTEGPFLKHDYEPVFQVDQNGQLDPLSSLLLDFFRGWALIVVVGGPLWALWMIPSYLARWQQQPGLMGYLTQCFLIVFAPAFLGIARACRVSNQRIYKRYVRFHEILTRTLGLAALVACLGFLIWDLVKLDDFLALYKKDPVVAGMGICVLLICLGTGLILGWSIGRSCDEQLRRFHEQVRQELEVRRQRHA